MAKIETLEKLADLLDVSVPTLLGVGVEYIASAVSYFERMRQIEETAEHIIVLAGPISYVLASDGFDRALGEVLREWVPEASPPASARSTQIDELMDVLRQRKESYRRAPARDRQPDRGRRDGALPAQRPGRPPRSSGQDPPRAPRARARRGRAFHRADGGRADRRADRHRARHAAAYELSDFPPARPA